MKYFITLDVEVEDEKSEGEVRHAIEGVAGQAQSGWLGLTGDPKVTVRTVKMAERSPLSDLAIQRFSVGDG
jgi:hypothetical protein